MKFGDFFKKDEVAKLANENVARGDTFLMRMDSSNGIVPKPGDSSRNKFFIVLGKHTDGSIFGGVVINSAINRNIPAGRQRLLMPIKCSKYIFLDHDSYVDCSNLKTARPEEYNNWQYKGMVSDEDVNLIIGTLVDSEYETREKLNRFGIKPQ